MTRNKKERFKEESRWVSLLKFKYCFANVLIISFQIFLLFLQQFGSTSISLNICIIKAFFPLTLINIFLDPKPSEPSILYRMYFRYHSNTSNMKAVLKLGSVIMASSKILHRSSQNGKQNL